MSSASASLNVHRRRPLIMIRNICESLFRIDLRALAVFRIFLGTVLIYDLLIRLQDLRMFYTDQGILPRDLAIRHLGRSVVGLSLNLMSGDAWFQALLFAAMFVSAAALLIGYKTRIANISSWFLLISLCSRNSKINNGGDNLLWMLLFWCMFLPLGAYYSLDSKRLPKRDSAAEPSVFSFGSAGLLLQVVYMYFSTAYLKSGAEWKDGSALYYALSVDLYCKPFAKVLLQFPEFLSFMTHATIFIERFGPILLLFPFKPLIFRMIGIMCFVMLHAGISSVMRLGIFPIVDFISLIPFIPSAAFNWILVRSVDGKRKADPKTFKFLPCHHKTPWAINCVAGFFFIYTVWWGLGTFYRDLKMPRSIESMAYPLKLYQNWKMFAPSPSRYDGWFVIVGLLDNGQEIDLFRGGSEVRWTKPKDVSGEFESFRQKQYMCQMLSYKFPKPLIARYCEYIRSEWQKKLLPSKRSLKEVNMYFVEERTLPDYAPSTAKKRLLYSLKR